MKPFIHINLEPITRAHNVLLIYLLLFYLQCHYLLLVH